MNRFDPHGDRDKPMLHIVSYHDVPMWRVQAFVFHDCELHGAKISIASGIRTDTVIEEHNRLFHTNLHGQQWCIDMHRKDPANYAAANPVNQTSHCGFSDGSAVYRDVHGHQIAATGRLPQFMWGVDVDDLGKVEDNSHLLHVAHGLGFDLLAPYNSGSEHHHLVNGRDPIHILESRGVISANRSS